MELHVTILMRYIVCFMCICNSGASSPGLTITFDKYLKLLDAITEAKNLAQNSSDQQLLLQQTVKTLQGELTFTKSKLSDLENETSDMSNRTREASNELKWDYTKLKKEYSKLKSHYEGLANESEDLRQELAVTKGKLKSVANETEDASNRTTEMLNAYNKLQFEYSKLQHQYEGLGNETRDLKINLGNLENETNDISNQTVETSSKYEKLKVENSMLQSRYEDLVNVTNDMKSGFLPIWNKIAAIQGDVTTIQNMDCDRCCNETNRLEKEIQEIHEKVTGLVSQSNSRNDDLVSLNEKLIKEEKSIKNMESVVHELSVSLNISQSSNDDKLSQLKHEMVQGLKYSNESTNENVQKLFGQIETLEMKSIVQESNYTRAIKMVSEEMALNVSGIGQKLEQEIQTLQKTYYQSLELYKRRVEDQLTTMEVNMSSLLNSSSKTCQERAMFVDHKVEAINERQNRTEQTILNNLDILDAHSKTLETNVSDLLHELSSQCSENISAIETDITRRLLAMQLFYNTSIEQNAKDIKTVEGKSNFVRQSLNLAIHSISTKSGQNIHKISALEGRLNTEADKLHNLQNYSRKSSEDIDKLQKQVDNLQFNQTATTQNLFETVNQSISVVKVKFDNDLQTLTESLLNNYKNITSLENELDSRDNAVNDRLNKSVTSLQHEIDDLQGETCVLKFNQSNVRTQITNEIAQNLTSVEHRFKDVVTKVMEHYNTSVESIANSVNMLQGRVGVFELDITRAMNNVFHNLDKNISEIETGLESMVQSLNSSHATSLQSILVNLTEHKAQMLNLNLALQNVSIEEGRKIKDIETGIRNELMLITTKHDKKVQDEIDQFKVRLNAMATNVTQAPHPNRNDKVAVMACSSTSILKLTGGSVIPFRNTRLRQGVSDTNSFNTTGKFVCETPGLYLISAQIMSYSKGAAFIISKNGREITRVQVAPYHDSDSHNYHTGTGLAVADLKLDDKIWIEVHSLVPDMQIFGSESCLNIVNLK